MAGRQLPIRQARRAEVEQVKKGFQHEETGICLRSSKFKCFATARTSEDTREMHVHRDASCLPDWQWKLPSGHQAPQLRGNCAPDLLIPFPGVLAIRPVPEPQAVTHAKSVMGERKDYIKRLRIGEKKVNSFKTDQKVDVLQLIDPESVWS
ncbi:hypothetical protein K438DRAFT_1780199 [Mycena galopus ATCC 62051]|nr:hypothetical protein K438DRAFT_1780199 [Mycena galopus ATCC 62051]